MQAIIQSTSLHSGCQQITPKTPPHSSQTLTSSEGMIFHGLHNGMPISAYHPLIHFAHGRTAERAAVARGRSEARYQIDALRADGESLHAQAFTVAHHSGGKGGEAERSVQ